MGQHSPPISLFTTVRAGTGYQLRSHFIFIRAKYGCSGLTNSSCLYQHVVGPLFWENCLVKDKYKKSEANSLALLVSPLKLSYFFDPKNKVIYPDE